MAKVMIVDGGARGHALAEAYLRSLEVDEVLVAPGNRGMICPDIRIRSDTSLKDSQSFLSVAQEYQPDLIDVAQDDALAAGTVDLLVENDFRTFGPTQAAARIESDKVWARMFMNRHDISQPTHKAFFREDWKAEDFAYKLLDESEIIFIKAAGLYAGKGVISASNKEEVVLTLEQMKSMGPAAEKILIDKGEIGEEFSYKAMVGGEHYLCFRSAQDNKRVWNQDKGPMTGGMGCNSPALVTKGLEDTIEEKIIGRAVAGLYAEGIPFTGILYLGGMLCEDGSVKVIEFNARWGDPECTVILPGIQNDYFQLVNAAIDGKLDRVQLEQDDLTRVCVVGASAGYPRDYEKGKRLWIDESGFPADTHYLSAGIDVRDGQMYTADGRVFDIVATDTNVIGARRKALQAMACCDIEDNGLYYRTDTAWRDTMKHRDNMVVKR